jgi:hypothetical protein
MPVHIFVGGAIVAPLVLRVENDIVVGFRVVASVAIIVVLGLVVVITIRRLPRVRILIDLFPLAERIFAGFAL